MWNLHLALFSQKSNETTSTHQTMHAKDTSLSTWADTIADKSSFTDQVNMTGI
jgi:hypothetical protein